MEIAAQQPLELPNEPEILLPMVRSKARQKPKQIKTLDPIERPSALNALTGFNKRSIRYKEKMIKYLKDEQVHFIQTKVQLAAMLRVHRLMIDAASILQKMRYPIKEGNIVIRMMDQIRVEIQELGASFIRFQHSTFLRNLFEDDNFTLTLTQQGPVESSNSIQEEEKLQMWDLQKTMRLATNIKTQMLLRQISFLVRKVKVGSILRQSKLVVKRMDQALKNRKKTEFSHNHHQVKKVSFSKHMFDEFGYPKHNFKKKATIKMMEALPMQSEGNVNESSLGSGTVGNESVFKHSHYNILWNSMTKQYQKIFTTAKNDEKISTQSLFVDELNRKLKMRKDQMQDTSLIQALQKNTEFTVGTSACFAMGFIALWLNGNNSIISAFGLVMLVMALGLGFLVYRLMDKEVYCTDTFKSEINKEILFYFQINESDFILQMQSTSHDINLTLKDPEG